MSANRARLKAVVLNHTPFKPTILVYCILAKHYKLGLKVHLFRLIGTTSRTRLRKGHPRRRQQQALA
jgi:hypothetical protein